MNKLKIITIIAVMAFSISNIASASTVNTPVNSNTNTNQSANIVNPNTVSQTHKLNSNIMIKNDKLMTVVIHGKKMTDEEKNTYDNLNRKNNIMISKK